MSLDDVGLFLTKKQNRRSHMCFLRFFGKDGSLLKRRPVINWCVEINAPRAADFDAPRRDEINRAAVMDQKTSIRNTIESIKFPRGWARP